VFCPNMLLVWSGGPPMAIDVGRCRQVEPEGQALGRTAPTDKVGCVGAHSINGVRLQPSCRRRLTFASLRRRSWP
jgi:hypothetical protein